MRVGVIGLGTMGGRMVQRLLAAGHEVAVHDPVVPAIAGTTACGSAAAVAEVSEIILSSVPMPADVEAVYLGAEGVRSAARPDLVCADLSTIDPDTARRVAAALAVQQVSFLDAPVSGGPSGVERGTLAVMIGGEAAAVERVRPVLAAFAGAITHLGPVGAGSTVKLANQLLVGAQTLAVIEAMLLCERAGLDPMTVYETLSASAGDSVMLRRNVPTFLVPRQFEPAFAMRLLMKDLRLLVGEANRLGLGLEVGRLTRQVYERGLVAGLAAEDYAAIVKIVEQ